MYGVRQTRFEVIASNDENGLPEDYAKNNISISYSYSVGLYYDKDYSQLTPDFIKDAGREAIRFVDTVAQAIAGVGPE